LGIQSLRQCLYIDGFEIKLCGNIAHAFILDAEKGCRIVMNIRERTNHPLVSDHQTLAAGTPQFVIGIGASAGGLEAFQALLSAFDDVSQLAFVFVQRFDPSNRAKQFETLSEVTKLALVPITDGTKIAAGKIYLAPPESLVEITQGVLHLRCSKASVQPLAPIDHFLQSLAEDQGERSVGVILSGAGSDGVMGLKAISEHGGLTFTQSPDSAGFASMPQHAVSLGVADHAMSPQEMGKELKRHLQHAANLTEEHVATKLPGEIQAVIPLIAELLLKHTKHNFQHYKTNTLIRRIHRRMKVLKFGSVNEYVDRLQTSEEEPHALFRELLIGVTSFFRDPEAFQTIQEQVLPKLFKRRSGNGKVRIWVAGCADGAEAYTLAMLCREAMHTIASPPEVQIFATDIDSRALQVAREGAYPIGIESQVTPERLKRFFLKRGKRYHVTREIRELVLFSSHNLISDPPFSRQDLISCRNLLIYLGSHLQNKLIPLFHYALRPDGYLFLGQSESITSHGELFRPVDIKARVSQRKGTAIGSITGMTYQSSAPQRDGEPSDQKHAVDLTNMMQKIALDEFTPKTAVIDDTGQVLTSSPNINKYLSIAGGLFQNNIIKMADSGLRIGLRAAIADARKTRRRVQHENLSVRDGDQIQRVMLTVQPMPSLGEDEPLYLVVFHDIGLPVDREEIAELDSDHTRDADSIIAHLERELETTREDLGRMMQDMEAANEELKSSNEELLSMNEELQSANEELETSREEIRVTNDAVVRANDDLENLLRSTEIATVFLDDELRIRSFTPAISQVYGLIAADVGRPLEQFVPLVEDMPPLPDPQSIHQGHHCEDTIVAKSGKAFIRRVLPYQTRSGTADGIVVTFTDVTELRTSKEQLAHQENQLRSITDALPALIAYVGRDQRYRFVNIAHATELGRPIDQILGSHIRDVLGEEIYAQVLPKLSRSLQGERLTYELPLRIPGTGQVAYKEITYVPQFHADGSIDGCHVLAVDVTQRRQMENELADKEAHLRRVIDNMLGFVSVLDCQGILHETNETAIVAGGIARDDVIGKPFWDCYWWSYDSQIAAQLQAAFNRALEGERVRYDVLVRMANDSRMIIDFMLVPVHDADGNITHLIASGIDINDRKLAEQRLIENEHRVSMALRAGGMGAWEWTPTKSVWDPAVFELLGIDPVDHPTTELFFRYVHPQDLPQVQAVWERAVAGESEYQSEFRIVQPDGKIRWLAGVGSVIRDGHGNVVRIHGLNWDMTDKKEFERRIIASEERLRLALSAAELKLWQWEIVDDNMLWSNDVGEQAGVDPITSIGGLHEFLQMVHPDDRNRVAKTLQASLEQGQPYRCEYRIAHTPPSYRWVMSLAHLTTKNGDSPTQMIGIELDITARKQSERAIELSEERLRVAAAAAGFGTLHIDLRKNHVTYSPELKQLVGYPPDHEFHLPPGQVPEFVHPEDRERFESYYRNSILSQRQPLPPLDHRIMRPDGELRWMRLQTKTLHGSRRNRKQPTQIIGTLLDITQQHQYEDSLQEARQMAEVANASKSEFLANMSHEIRTPMTAILGYAELIADLIDHHEALAYVQTIRRNGDFLLEIINDILDLSKIEAGKLEISPQRFAPSQLVEDVRSIMEVRAREGGLSLSVEYAGQIPTEIVSDPKRLKQILINLVGNAIKFTRQGSVRLRVSYLPNEKQMRFDVVDTGIGISPQHQSRLFKPFVQGDSSVSRDFGGTGLGLAISQRLAKVLGGNITVESAVGQGSTFTLVIASGTVDQNAMIDPETMQQPRAKTNSPQTIKIDCHVLIVDDRRDIRFLSQRLLTKAGARVTEAEDGQVAVETVKDHLQREANIDLILLDMQMPNLDGYQTAIELRRLGYAGPIIALTADAMQGDMKRCIQCGCNDYLSKPIDTIAMLEMVKRYVDPKAQLAGPENPTLPE